MKSSTNQGIENIKKDQSGQSFVEYILLLAGITIISFGFLKSINGETAKKWKIISEVILNNGEKSGSQGYKKLEIR